MYINLLNHSNYSLLSSSLKIADIIKNSLENNSKFCSLIDIDTMFQTLEFYKLCEKNNLIPIIGLQINYLNDTLGIFALNNEGLSNLYKISNLVSKKEYGNIFKLLNNTIVISYNNKKNELIEKNCSFYYFFNELSIKENYCEKKEDLEILQALYAIKNSISLEEAEKEFIIMEPHFLSKEEYENKYSNEQKEKLLDLVSKINIKIEKKAKIDFVKFSNDSRKEIRELCEYGLFKKEKNKDEKYIKRMNYELSIIDKMGFNDYFLVIRDFIQFAKKNNIFTGPGRGSAAGSLVSYLLDITMVDPVSNNLIFERFLNIDRNDMPDIDVDIEDSERMKVINYLFEKYGKNNVAHIVTFQRMKTKMALTDVGRILKIELSTIKNITSLFGVQIDDSSIEKAIEQSEKIKKQAQNFPQLFKIANQIINFPRNIGVHAAGIVLCESNLINKVPTLEVNGKTLIQYEGSFLEPLGLVKLDILGLSNLTIVKDIIELIKQNEDLEIDLTKINLEVPQVYSQLSSGDTIGIFQLESSGMTNTIKKVKPKCLEDLSIVLALYRPGAVENMNLYLENKKDSSKIKYLNDSFEKILGSTFNIPIYQEQIMELIKSTANYSYSKADIFRRIISKKKIEQLKEMKKDFLNDALLNNFSLKEANEIFAYIEKFTGYGFNHSHSLAYATLSY
jgi:DNA polymerase-3 subunit alpha